jgi:hypothetical protein
MVEVEPEAHDYKWNEIGKKKSLRKT